MFGADRSETEKVLLQLEDLFFTVNGEQFGFVKNHGHLCLLGTGATSNVYEMYGVTAPDRHCALKVIGFGDKDPDHSFVRRVFRVQHALSELSENIVRVIALWVIKLSFDEQGKILRIVRDTEDGFDDLDGYLFEMILMEKLENIISKDRYGNVEPLRKDLADEAGVIRFAIELGEALLAVHRNNFLHRDIKLENVFWDEQNGRYKLGDFGIVRATDNGNAETVVFTNGYGAPEIEKRLQDSYDITADIYSYGITLYLLLNDLAFPGSDSYRPSIVQYEKDFVFPAPKNASPKMAAIVRKMCSYRPCDRYRSVDEVLAQIRGLTDQDDRGSEACPSGSVYDAEAETYAGDPATVTFRETTVSEADEDEESDVWEESDEGEESDVWEESDEYISEEGVDYNGYDLSIWDKDESELTYEEKKYMAAILKKEYNKRMVLETVVASLLFFLLFVSMSKSADRAGSWMIWTLPAVMVTECILQKIGTFHIGFGMISCALYIWSAVTLGCDALQVAMICVTLVGLPVLSAGCAAGAGLWIAYALFGNTGWLSFLNEYETGFIFMIALAGVFADLIRQKIFYAVPISRHDYALTAVMLDILPYTLLGAGLILWILGLFDIFSLPAVESIHPVKTGIGIFIVKILFNWQIGKIKELLTEEINHK